MSIISSTYTVGHAQIDGRKFVTETHTDDTGGVHMSEYLAAIGTDYNAIMIDRVPQIELQLAEAEAAALLT